MSDAQPLWSDERIDKAAMDDGRYPSHYEAARSALRKMRAEYEAELQRLRSENAELERMVSLEMTQALMIGELQAKLADSQPAAQPSTPLAEIVAQLRSCGYECEAGPIEQNVAWQELERMAGQPDVPQPDPVVPDAAKARLRSITFSDDASNMDRYCRGFNDGYDFAMNQQRGVPQIDWSQAPDWAQWWAMDSNGTAYWHETKPVWSAVVGVWRSKWRSARNYRLDPNTTLQQRPQEPTP